MSIFDKLLKKQLFKNSIPSFLKNNVHYMTIMGSHAYGVADTSDSKKKSDFDVYGFCIPPKEMIFPHLAGEIQGFGRQKKRFEQWQEHHVFDQSSNTEYDFTIYNIIKYFQLCMENNPNMIDSLFTPQNCVLLCTSVGNHLRDNRKLFLHKGSWHKFKGYAYSQAQKMRTKHEAAKKLYNYEHNSDLDPEWIKKVNGYETPELQYTLSPLVSSISMKRDYVETLIEYRESETTMNNLRNDRESLHKGTWYKIRVLDSMHTQCITAEKLYNYEHNSDLDPEWIKKVNGYKDPELLHVLLASVSMKQDYVKTLIEYRESETKRTQSVREHGFDLKYGYHLVRLLGEVEQILLEGDLDLQRKDRREMMKSIRRGNWTLEEIMSWFTDKEKALERVYEESTLRYSPDGDKIKRILIECLEMHYGSLDNALKIDIDIETVLHDFQAIIDRYRKSLKPGQICNVKYSEADSQRPRVTVDINTYNDRSE